MKKRIDWDRLVPLGISAEDTRNNLITALAAGILWSFGFLFRFSSAKQALFRRDGSWKGFPIDPFKDLLGNAFWLLGILALLMPVVAAVFYFYHFQNGRSIYTMKRLPDSKELWRRCLTLPIWTAVLCGVLVLILTGIYYLVYLYGTPAGCLP